MPTVFVINGFRFYFYSNENTEPLHIHIERAEGIAKLWLDPEVILEYCYNFSVRDRREIVRLTKENRDKLIKAWYEHFE